MKNVKYKKNYINLQFSKNLQFIILYYYNYYIIIIFYLIFNLI